MVIQEMKVEKKLKERHQATGLKRWWEVKGGWGRISKSSHVERV